MLMPKRQVESFKDYESVSNQVMLQCQSSQESKIWDVEYCRKVTAERCSMSDIHKRKHEILIPGTLLKALDSDARVPILLVHRGSEDPGWDIVAPKGWGMSLLHLFQYAGCRPGSFQTVQVNAFENGMASEVFDLPETKIYQQLAQEKEVEKLKKYKTVPKKYRIAYPWSPFKIDVNGLCGNDVIVWHSERMVDIISKHLDSTTFDSFCANVLQDMQVLCKNRPALRITAKDLASSCVRVELKLKSGKIDWNAVILKQICTEIDSKIDNSNIVGYVLRGGFSFKDGNPRGIGIVSLKQLFECKGSVGIRNLTGRKTFEATYKLIP
jgi:hypothetical protein